MFTNEYFSDQVSARTGGRGSAKCRQLKTRGGGDQKSLKMYGHPLCMAPLMKKFTLLVFNGCHMKKFFLFPFLFSLFTLYWKQSVDFLRKAFAILLSMFSACVVASPLVRLPTLIECLLNKSYCLKYEKNSWSGYSEIQFNIFWFWKIFLVLFVVGII